MAAHTPIDPPPHVLITGVSGFIGAAVAHELVSRGATVTGLDDLSAGNPERHVAIERAAAAHGGAFRFVQDDVRNGSTLDELLDALPRERPLAIVHLAARVGVRRVLQDPDGCERENLDGCRALAAAIDRAGLAGTRLLAASTSEVYAESSDPLHEASALRPKIAAGRWRYAASKLRSEEVLDAATPAVHLRFFNVVGPGQDADSGMVLPRFVEAACAGEPLRVHGAGRQVRTFAHVDAVARDVATLAAPLLMGGTTRAANFTGALNVGGTARTTIRDLAARVVAETRLRLGRGGCVQHVDPEVDVAANFEDVRHRVPDLGRLRSLGLGAAPWDLDSIVRDTVLRHSGPAMACASPAS